MTRYWCGSRGPRDGLSVGVGRFGCPLLDTRFRFDPCQDRLELWPTVQRVEIMFPQELLPVRGISDIHRPTEVVHCFRRAARECAHTSQVVQGSRGRRVRRTERTTTTLVGSHVHRVGILVAPLPLVQVGKSSHRLERPRMLVPQHTTTQFQHFEIQLLGLPVAPLPLV